MSLGYGVGDVMAISRLAVKAYTATPDDYRNIADEVKSLHLIIEEAVRHLKSTALSNKKQQGGKKALEGCQKVLMDLDALIEKYNALASANTSQVFRRIKLGTEIVILWVRLILNTILLNSFIQSCDSHKLNEMQAQLNTVLGLRHSSSLVSYAGGIKTKKAYRNFCKGLFESGVTAEMIKCKGKEIHDMFKPPNTTTTTSSQIDINTNSETSPLPTISIKPNRNRSRFAWARPPLDFLIGPWMLDAAEAGDIKRLKSTLRYVRKIDFLDNTGVTALHKAASGGYNDIVQLLLTKGASIEVVNQDNDTPLHLAAWLGHTSTVELLLSKGASIEATNRSNETPLHYAALCGHPSIVKLLLSKGASIEVLDVVNYTPLHHATRWGEIRSVELLLSKGASIEVVNEDNYTPLHCAAMFGRTSIVELLLSKGASIEAMDKYNNTPLHHAAQHRNTSTVELLLSKGASIEATNRYNETPLNLARRSVVELLEWVKATNSLETYETVSG